LKFQIFKVSLQLWQRVYLSFWTVSWALGKDSAFLASVKHTSQNQQNTSLRFATRWN